MVYEGAVPNPEPAHDGVDIHRHTRLQIYPRAENPLQTVLLGIKKYPAKASATSSSGSL